MKNIHAGLVNCLEKSMKNSSSGLSLCLWEGGDHRMLVETQTPEGTRPDSMRGVWNSLCLVNITAEQPSQPGLEAPNVQLCTEPPQPGSSALPFFFYLHFKYLFIWWLPQTALPFIQLSSSCCNVHQSTEFQTQGGGARETQV